jgi:hypothetical protein
LQQATSRGIDGKEYERVIADLENTEKYYETVTTPDGTLLRRRRADVFPPSLVGLHRPIYSQPKKKDAVPRLIYY